MAQKQAYQILGAKLGTSVSELAETVGHLLKGVQTDRGRFAGAMGKTDGFGFDRHGV